MRSRSRIFFIATMTAVLPIIGQAQVNEAYADFTADIEAARTVMATERKILIMREMGLTPEEGQAFWPLYDEYAAEIKKVNGLQVKMITDFAANYENVTDEFSTQLLKEWVKFARDDIKVKEKYWKKFDKVLPTAKVARFVQIDNKLDAIVDFKLAMEIPLIEPAAASPASQ